jgi:hypothetical protein
MLVDHPLQYFATKKLVTSRILTQKPLFRQGPQFILKPTPQRNTKPHLFSRPNLPRQLFVKCCS